MDVSVIFVNYRTSQLTINAVKSVYEKTKGCSFECIVVDNSEKREEFLELRRGLSEISDDIQVYNSNGNIGFGNGNNLGASYAKGNYLMFLNTDTILLNDAISILYLYMFSHDEVGVVGPNIYTKNNEPNHSFERHRKDIALEKKYGSIYEMIRKGIFNRRSDYNYSDKPLLIEGYVCGAALMIKKNYFDQLCGFDKDIFMYAEESLLCYQVITKLKKQIYNVPEAKIVHYEGGSFRELELNRAKMLIDGNYIYYTKAFNDKSAMEFILNLKRISYKKLLLSYFFNRKKIQSYKNTIVACNNKIEEVTKV